MTGIISSIVGDSGAEITLHNASFFLIYHEVVPGGPRTQRGEFDRVAWVVADVKLQCNEE
jgi:hypothetical protein